MWYETAFKRWTYYQKAPILCRRREDADMVTVRLPLEEDHNPEYAWDVIQRDRCLVSTQWYYKSSWIPRSREYVEYQFNKVQPVLIRKGDTSDLPLDPA